MSDNTRKQAVPADDDRNLVLVDGDFNEADLDDKIWLFWERNRNLLVAGAALVFLAGLGFLALRSYRAGRLERIGVAYAVAGTPEMQVAFAERHRGEALAALAALESADAAYAKGEFGEAAKRYALADECAASAGETARPVAVRAAVCAALSEIRAGRADEGLRRLNALADSATAEKPAKLHALFCLAEHACGLKEFAKARAYLDRFDREAAGVAGWSAPNSPKAALIHEFPELIAPASAGAK